MDTKKFKTLRPEFSFDLKNLVQVKSFFTTMLSDVRSGNSVLLDLSRVKSVDSVGFKLINNVYNTLEKQGVSFSILCGSAELAEQFCRVLPNISLVDGDAGASVYGSVRKGTHWVNATIECPVCHNTDFPSEFLNQQAIKFIWKEHSLLPVAVNSTTDEEIDFYRDTLIMCSECLLTSFYKEDFICHSEGQEFPPIYSSDARTLLIKSTNRRKDMLAKIGVEQGDYLSFFADREHLDYAYRLCADCITATSFDRGINRFYEVGLAHFLVYNFMNGAKKDSELLEKAEMSFKDCIRFPPQDIPDRIWQSYYYLLVVEVCRGKQPQLLNLIDAFRKAGADPGKQAGAGQYEFWYRQAQKVYKKAINDVASKYSVA